MSYPENKVKRVEAAAEEHGWLSAVGVNRDTEETRVTVVRGEESMVFEWQGQKSTSVRYSFGGEARQMQNVAAALRQMAAEPDVVRSIKRGRRTRGSSTTVRGAVTVSEDMSDEEILKALCGKRIVWKTTFSEEPRQTRILAKNEGSPHYSVQRNGHVHINFVDEFGFRSVHLDAIVQVAR